MPRKRESTDVRTEEGRELARRLYDYRMPQLEKLSAAEKANLLKEYPKLGETEFDYVVGQVIAARRYEQQRIGWQAVPHDVAVLTMVIVTSLSDLRYGIVAGIAVLVLLESLFQFYFDQRLYRFLSALVWLTYPAYLLLAYVLYRRGLGFGWIVAVLLLTWGGTFLLGMLARLPVRLILDARKKADEEEARHQGK
jgi:hypothetical protein